MILNDEASALQEAEASLYATLLDSGIPKVNAVEMIVDLKAAVAANILNVDLNEVGLENKTFAMKEEDAARIEKEVLRC